MEPGLVVDKVGSKLNTDFFEGSNIVGTLKQKGYIDFKTNYPSSSEIEVTQVGARMLEVADEKAKEAVDELDLAVLQNVVAGYKEPDAIRNMLNIRSGDLAVHLHKLVKQDLISYSIKGKNIGLSITEDGFKRVSAMPKKEKPAEEEIVVTGEAAPVEPQAPAGPVKLDSQMRMNAKMEYYMEKWKKNPTQPIIYAAALILIILIALYLLFLR